MINKIKLGAAFSAALLFCASFTTQAFAEDCHRGTLDEGYCDRNLDQVADLPLDPKDWVDPKTIHTAFNYGLANAIMTGNFLT